MASLQFKAHIDKLKGALNWTRWKMLILLCHHEVLDIVSLPVTLKENATTAEKAT